MANRARNWLSRVGSIFAACGSRLRMCLKVFSDTSWAKKSVSGRQRSGATAAAAGGAGETMNASLNRTVLQGLRRDVPKIQLLAVLQLQLQHLIEIAIIKLAAVADAQRGAAH